MKFDSSSQSKVIIARRFKIYRHLHITLPYSLGSACRHFGLYVHQRAPDPAIFLGVSNFQICRLRFLQACQIRWVFDSGEFHTLRILPIFPIDRLAWKNFFCVVLLHSLSKHGSSHELFINAFKERRDWITKWKCMLVLAWIVRFDLTSRHIACRIWVISTDIFNSIIFFQDFINSTVDDLFLKASVAGFDVHNTSLLLKIFSFALALLFLFSSHLCLRLFGAFISD